MKISNVTISDDKVQCWVTLSEGGYAVVHVYGLCKIGGISMKDNTLNIEVGKVKE